MLFRSVELVWRGRERTSSWGRRSSCFWSEARQRGCGGVHTACAQVSPSDQHYSRSQYDPAQLPAPQLDPRKSSPSTGAPASLPVQRKRALLRQWPAVFGGPRVKVTRAWKGGRAGGGERVEGDGRMAVAAGVRWRGGVERGRRRRGTVSQAACRRCGKAVGHRDCLTWRGSSVNARRGGEEGAHG